MKQDESQGYICPLSIASGNKESCIGGQCAAWRWSEPKFGSVDKRRGFCGMAGEPKYPLNPDNEKN